MLGYLRLILAILVLLSHTGLHINQLNPGVIAVVIFYMLAGMVITHLWQDVLPQKPRKLLGFYQDRLMRIMPLYLFTLLLTLLFLSMTAYGKPEYPLVKLLNNILLIPLNYYMYIDSSILTKPEWCLIPPAWSLGVEMQVYILMPFLLMRPRLCLLVYIISIITYTAANYALLPADNYGYRLLPGVLFIFIIGSYIKKSQKSKAHRIIIILSYLGVILQYLMITGNNSLAPGFSQETLLGLLIGMPLLICLANIRIKLPFNSIAGSVSYGVFLMHFLFIWIYDELGFLKSSSVSDQLILVVSVCMGSLVSVYVVENKIKKIVK